MRRRCHSHRVAVLIVRRGYSTCHGSEFLGSVRICSLVDAQRFTKQTDGRLVCPARARTGEAHAVVFFSFLFVGQTLTNWNVYGDVRRRRKRLQLAEFRLFFPLTASFRRPQINKQVIWTHRRGLHSLTRSLTELVEAKTDAVKALAPESRTRLIRAVTNERERVARLIEKSCCDALVVTHIARAAVSEGVRCPEDNSDPIRREAFFRLIKMSADYTRYLYVVIEVERRLNGWFTIASFFVSFLDFLACLSAFFLFFFFLSFFSFLFFSFFLSFFSSESKAPETRYDET